MANEGAIPGIPRPLVSGDYELIWNAAIVERHMHLSDLGIQNNDELILVFRPQSPPTPAPPHHPKKHKVVAAFDYAPVSAETGG